MEKTYIFNVVLKNDNNFNIELNIELNAENSDQAKESLYENWLVKDSVKSCSLVEVVEV